MKAKNKNLTPMLLSLLVMALWGSLFPLVKLGYKEFGINTNLYSDLLFFAGVRFTVSGVLITVFQSVRQKSLPTLKVKNELPGVLLVGVFAVVLHYAFTYFGLAEVESSKTALLKQSGVLVFIFFSFLFIKEDKLSVGKGIGAILGIASIILLNYDSVGISFGLGELFIVLASFCTVVSSVVCKKALSKTDAIVVTGYSELIGGIVLLISGVAFGGRFALTDAKSWLLFAYIILATCVGYVLWYSLIQKHELSKMFIIKFSEPLFAAIIGAAVLKENLLQLHYISAFLCVGLAVTVSNLRFGKERVKKETEENQESGKETDKIEELSA